MATYNSKSDTIITGTNARDIISNRGKNVTIYALTGNDSISNLATQVSIDGGTGNDIIRNYIYGSEVLINTGDGNDTIENNGGSNVTINGGAGKDSIVNGLSIENDIFVLSGGTNTTINNTLTLSGGAGDDYIVNEAANFVYVYANGDGNDVIEGFNATSTLKIGNGTGTYSMTKNGSDIIVTVGKGKITLDGAATLSTINIAGTIELLPPIEAGDS